MDKVRKLKDEANLFLLVYELGDGKDLNLLRHSVDSLKQAEKLEDLSKGEDKEL